MARPRCSVVMAAYKRRSLLERSLAGYQAQDFDNSRFELVVIDDHGDDGTRELVLDWSKTTGIAATVMTVAPKPAEWVDCAWVLNAGIRAAAGDNILLTHPEAIPGRRSVAACVEELERFEEGRLISSGHGHLSSHYPIGAYAACRVYYLSVRDQQLIDTVPWRAEGNLAARQIPGFYDADPNGNPDYTHAVTDKVGTPGFRIKTWDSWVFGGFSRRTLKLMGGLQVSQRWGSVDILLNDRRKRLGMHEWTCPEDESIVIHQEHSHGQGDTPTPRDMAAWQRECHAIDKTKLVWPDVDELGWGG